MNLTSAPEFCFDKNIDEEDRNDREKRHLKLKIISYLQAYKEVIFTHSQFWMVFLIGGDNAVYYI